MPDQEAPSPAEQLEQRLQTAALGSKQAARLFFESLLTFPLFVPERYQAQPLSNAPSYPNDFVSILGVQDRDRAAVPAFTRKEHVLEWCGAELECKQLTGEELFALVPQGWWLVLNPGRDVEKEFSPWEIAELRNGTEGIAAVLEEIFAEDIIETLDVKPVSESGCPALCAALRRAAEADSSISAIRLFREEGKDADGNPAAQILIGVEAPTLDSPQLDALQEKIRAAAAPCQIGNDPFKVIVSRDMQNSPALGLFKDAPPLYRRKQKRRGLLSFFRI